MSQAQHQMRTNNVEPREWTVRVLGGTNAVSKASGGEGMTVTYVDAGRFTLTWSQVNDPGVFVGAVATYQATTPGDVKNYVTVFEPYASRSIRVNMYESGTLTNLAASEWITVILKFEQTKGTF